MADKRQNKKRRGKVENNGMRLNRDALRSPPPGPSPQREEPEPEYRYTKSFDGPSGRVPPLDAFDRVPRRMPPPHVREQLEREAELLRRKQAESAGGKKGAGKGAARKRRRAARKARVTGPPQAGANARPVSAPAGAGGEPPSKAGKKRARAVTPQKIRRRRRRLSVVLLGLLLVAGILFSVNMLFKIETFQVEGDSPYSRQQIVQHFEPQVGDNLFTFSKKAAQERIEASLPYIAEVNIRRVLPGTVVFSVSAATETYYMAWGGQYAVLSESMKVLKFVQEQPVGLIGILGLPDIGTAVEGETMDGDAGEDEAAQGEAADGQEADPAPEETAQGDETAQEASPAEKMTVQVGYPLASEDEQAFYYLNLLLEALSTSPLLEELDWIDVTDPLSMQVHWQGRITIFIGSQTGLSDKISMAQNLLLNSTEQYFDDDQEHTLDLSMYPDTLEARSW